MKSGYVFLGIILFLLVVPSRLVNKGKSNIIYLEMINHISSDAVSPYACLLAPICAEGESPWRFQGKEDQIQLVLSASREKLSRVSIPLDRKHFFTLAQGGLRFQAAGLEAALDPWRRVPAIGNYMMNLADTLTEQEARKNLLIWSLEIEPSFLAYYKLGQLHEGNNELGKAIDAFLHASALAKENREQVSATHRIRLYHSLGDVYWKQHAYELAEASYRQAVRIGQWNSSYIRLAKALIAQGQTAEAVMVLEKARQLGPDVRMISYQLSHAYVANQEWVKAKTELGRLIERGTTFPGAWLLLGKVEAEMGNEDAALEAWQTYMTLNPDDRTIDKRIRRLLDD